MQETKFVMMRDRTVTSTLGHSIEFKKGVPTHVPKPLWAEVQAQGAVPEDELPEEVVKRPNEPTETVDRLNAIVKVIGEMVAANNRDDFTAAGLPHTKVLSDKLGWKVEAAERDKAFDAFNNPDK